jgi:gamma-glutamylcysteine synthetase
VQLDVSKDKLISTIKAFSLLEPVKSLLFSNAWMKEEPDNLCVRDMFWENSTHGINPHNIGMFERLPDNIDELLEYISRTSIFCTEREGHYLFFKPVPIIDYFDKELIEAEYYENGSYHSYTFRPEKSDISFLRTYKFEDLTYRGTIEYRSACCQPFADAMTIAAFHVGLQDKVDELNELFDNDTVLYHHGYTPGELRKLMNKRKLPQFVDSRRLNRLLMKVLDLAADGLSKRGLSEETYLAPLYERDKSPALKMLDGLDSGMTMKDFIYEYATLERKNSNHTVKAG